MGAMSRKVPSAIHVSPSKAVQRSERSKVMFAAFKRMRLYLIRVKLGVNINRVKRPGECIPGAFHFQQCASDRSDEHTSELQSLLRISYAGFCLKKQKITYVQE